jgi:chromosome segregation ATPase
MTEDRLDRIEAQISETRDVAREMQQNMLAMQQNMTAMQQNITAMQQNMTALREDMVGLRQRVDSIEGSTILAIRDGFESLRTYLDDVNYDLSNNERRTRRLGRRVSRLENLNRDDEY